MSCDWQRAEELFHATLERAPEARRAVLEREPDWRALPAGTPRRSGSCCGNACKRIRGGGSRESAARAVRSRERVREGIAREPRRRLARQHLARRRGESLESAALANEAYLKLTRAGGIRCENRTHFLALCSQIIRRLLVDHARRRGFAKRGGAASHVVPDAALLAAETLGIEVLALDRALDELSRLDGRKCRVVELRYFGGLSIEETAETLGVSVETAKRDWRMARAWLAAELTGRQEGLAGFVT